MIPPSLVAAPAAIPERQTLRRSALGAGGPLALLAALVGCGGSAPEPAVALTPPTTMCAGDAPASSCRNPAEVEELLARAPLEVLAADDPPAGKQDAKVLTLRATTPRGPVVFRAKWRAASSAHQLNSPRKEVAAHAVQKLILPPNEWVVPPAASRCLPVEVVRARIDPTEKPSFDGARCVLGFLSYWLEDARGLDAAEDQGVLDEETPLDPETTRRSPTFRRSVADVNLMAHLISHGDSHPEQFVVTGTRRAPSVRLVDNTIAFTPYVNPSLGEEWDWSKLQVPAVRKATIDRLRALRPEDLERLLVIEQHARRDGMLVAEPPGAAPPESPGGIAWVGDRLQIGLTRDELALLRTMVGSVLERVDSGRLPTF